MSNVPPAIRKPQSTGEPTYFSWCWLAHHGVWDEGLNPMPSCHGRQVKAHLIRQQTILRQIPAEFSAGLLWSDDVWVFSCGGIMGNAGHHGALDVSKRLRVPRAALPSRTVEFAREWGLEWWLDRTYGKA